MSRAHLDYTQRRVAAPSIGFNPDVPTAGLYQMRLVSGGVFVAIRIWNGAPLDPVTGEELDRSPRWQAQANGEPIPIDRVWPKCADAPIDLGEFEYLTARQSWAAKNAPDSVFANPKRRIDPLTAPTPF